MGITLYGERLWDSPWVFTVLVALKEKGLAFEERSLDLVKKEHKAGDLPAKSLTGKVPMLVHDGFWLTESMAITEYLEECFPAPGHPRLFPEDVRDRARTRQVMSWLRSDLSALRRERSTETMFYSRATEPLSEAGEKDARRLIEIAQRLVHLGSPSMVGSFTLADADLAFMLHRLILNGDPVPAEIKAYAEAIWQRPSVRAYVDRERPATSR